MAGDEGSRRRLPSWSWMKKPDDGDKSNNSVQENKISCETKRQRKIIPTQPLATNIKKRKLGKYKKPTPRDDGEGEFSVEDLLSIAKEFVQIDLDTAELQSVDTDLESQYQRLKTTSCEDGISDCNLTSVQSRTVDPAQDMLDLFLGPLLKKPRGDKEKKTEFTTNDEGFRQLSQNDVGEEMVSHMKSKSSLKDKLSSNILSAATPGSPNRAADIAAVKECDWILSTVVSLIISAIFSKKFYDNVWSFNWGLLLFYFFF